MGTMKGDTRNLDNGPYRAEAGIFKGMLPLFCRPLQAKTPAKNSSSLGWKKLHQSLNCYCNN